MRLFTDNDLSVFCSILLLLKNRLAKKVLIYLSTYLLIYLFTYLLIYLFTYLLIYLFTYSVKETLGSINATLASGNANCSFV